MSAEQLTKTGSILSSAPQLSLVTKTHGERKAGVSAFLVAGAQSRLVFMFPGGGAQYPGMGRELYESQPVFRAQFDCCAALATKYLSIDLREPVLTETPSAMDQPSVALPALFATEYALAKLWIALGVRPNAMIGHSLGEYVAACLSGVFSLEDAIRLVGLRGLLFEKVGIGAMLSVPLPCEAISGLLGDRLSLAAVNGPNLCVVAGRCSDIERLQTHLDAMQVETQRIPIAVPAHSSLLDCVCDELFGNLLQIHLYKPEVRFISNVTGNWISDSEATDPTYWVRHFRDTVQFASGMNTLVRDNPEILLEVGPGRVMSSLAKLNVCDNDRLILPSMRKRNEFRRDPDVLYSSLTQIAKSGFEVSPGLFDAKKMN